MANLILLFVFEIIMFAMAYMLCEFDIMAPSVIMILMFIFSTFCALLNINAWAVDFGTDTMAILTTGMLCFLLVEVFWVYLHRNTNIYLHKSANEIETYHSSINVQRWKIVLIVLFDILVLILQYREEIRIAKTFGYSGSGNFITYYRNAAIITADTTERQINGFVRQLIKFVNVFGYVALYIFINNVFINKEKVRKNRSLLLLVLFSFARAIMAASRLDILRYIVFGAVSFYVLQKQNSGWTWKIDFKLLMKVFAGILVFIAAFYFAAGLFGRTTQAGKTFSQYITWYVGGSIECFDLFLKRGFEKSTTWGQETFAGMQTFFWRLGLVNREMNGRTNLQFVSSGILRANVYTFFRRPLKDFGLAGMYIFTGIVSSLFSWIYYFIIKKPYRGRLINDVWIMFYGYLYIWVAVAFMDNYSILFITPSIPFMFLIFYFVYWFLKTPIVFVHNR